MNTFFMLINLYIFLFTAKFADSLGINQVSAVSYRQVTNIKNNYSYRYKLARAYAYSGKRIEAIKILTEMIAEKPNNTDLRYFRGVIFSWEKRWTLSEMDLQKVLRKNPNNSEALSAISNMYIWSKQYKKAITPLNKLVKLKPDNPDYLMKLADLEIKTGNTLQAKKYLNLARKYKNKKFEINKMYNSILRDNTNQEHTLAWKTATSGNKYKAYKMYNQILSKNPNNVNALISRGKILSWVKKYDKAKKDILKAIDLEPKNSEAWMALGNVYLWSKDKKSAEEAYENSIKFSRSNAAGYLSLARINASNQNFFKSRKFLKKVFQLHRFTKEANSLKNTIDRNPEAMLWEIQLGTKQTSFEPHKDLWRNISGKLSRKFRHGSISLEWLQADRFRKVDQYMAIDTYFDLWNRSYGNFRFLKSDDSGYLPRNDKYLEIFQGFGKGWETSIYSRQMMFGSNTYLYGISLAKYISDWYARYRLLKTSSGGKSHSIMLRKYFKTAEDFIDIEYGWGNSPLDISYRPDLKILKRESYRIRFETYVTLHWGFYLEASYRDEKALNIQNSFSGGVRRRW